MFRFPFCIILIVANMVTVANVAIIANPITVSQVTAGEGHADRIQPYKKNLHYWQYKGKPVMLLGGSDTDHIFLHDQLKDHLDEIASVGANYVRCTMSQREGLELKPHKRLSNGKFDLNQWNEDYWKRFENCLKWCDQRDIIIQIEVWDRFDYTDARGMNYWKTSPWRPANNINYTNEQSGFQETYKDHPSRDKQPFFHTVSGLKNYRKKYDLIREYQEKFVSKMLSYTLQHGNVLYCMNNETSTPARWGQYWIEFIQDKAKKQGVTVITTDMFDDAFEGEKAKNTGLIFTDTRHYLFADISQVNSRNYDEMHWDKLQELLQQIDKHPRPSNHTKIYGSGYFSFGTGGPEDGIERFWRNIIGGSASSRFHRPDAGNGLNDFAKASIKAARILESKIEFWKITPQMNLLSKRSSNEAYLAAEPGESYALYFTNGGSVGLNLSGVKGTFDITWISISQGIITQTSASGGYRKMDKTIQAGNVITLTAPYKGGWVAAIVKK